MNHIILVFMMVNLLGCSVDLIPVHYSRVNSARSVHEPIARGPQAPGAFRAEYEMKMEGGYRWDPTQIELKGGIARMIPSRDPAMIETRRGREFVALDTFHEELGPSNQGLVKYQLSPDGTHWYYYDGAAWKAAMNLSTQTNPASVVSSHIGHFHSEVGSGSLFVRAYFLSPTGREVVELRKWVVEGISPKTDGWK